MPRRTKTRRLFFKGGMVLFFCLLAGIASAATPTAVSISPAYGTSLPDAPVTFTAVYSDSSGWQHISSAYLLVNTSASGKNCLYVYYNRATNKLYLRNDDNTAWLGGYTLGSSNTITNTYSSIDCAGTSASGSGINLTIKWKVSFKSPFSSTLVKNTYLYASDASKLNSGMIQKGTWLFGANSPPAVGTVSPSSGASATDTPLTFTTTYTDPNGWQDIQYVFLLINTSTSYANCFFGYYNLNTNKLYLRDDAGVNWIGGFAPGSANTIENSYVKVNCAQTTISGSGTTLTVKWNLTFKPSFVGTQTKNIYLYVRDDSNSAVGFTQKGTTLIGANSTPTLGAVSPSSGSGQTNTAVNFTTTCSDSNGWQDIKYSYFLMNASCSGTNGLYGYYSQNDNKLYLRSDDNTTWLGGYAPKSANIIANSYVKLDCSKTSVSGSGNTLTITWNVSFTDSFASAKAKNVYLKVYDDSNACAGFTQKGAWTVLEGRLIGTGGGEVLSPDGKVKLIIPAGALTKPTQIAVLNVKKETVANAIPNGTSLLSIVECKPYGLVFKKPAAIIYTLWQAEIPGTSVELGFYDSAQKKILPTGNVSTIGTDNYTVSFQIVHFSTYAALKSLTPQQTPIGSGVKIPLPDMLTGAFSHAIPITVPAGRKGVQPSIGLSYRSSNPNSWVGLGFSLNPGYIVRSTRLGPPKYIDTQDTFYFISDAGTTELTHLVDNLYQAKIESAFTKFFKEADDSWRLVSKDGSILRFGQTADSKEGSAQGTFSWYLTKAADTNGNYIEYSYIKDEGKAYLSRIDYTGNETGISPTDTVEFFLESRDDVSSSYLSSAKIKTAKRLKEVTTKVNSGLVWRYVLEYEYSPDTNRSLLKSVKQFASDDKSLPEQSLSYQRAQ